MFSIYYMWLWSGGEIVKVIVFDDISDFIKK